MRFFDVLNESNVELRKSESTFSGRRGNENVRNMEKRMSKAIEDQKKAIEDKKTRQNNLVNTTYTQIL